MHMSTPLTLTCFLLPGQIERASLADQVQSLRGELSRARAEQQSLTDQLNAALREVTGLKR